MTDRRGWAPSSSEYNGRLRAAQRAGGSRAEVTASDRAVAQLELTGITWDDASIRFDRIAQVGVEVARHRFRAAIPDLIWNAAALEGNTFTLPEVRTLLDGVTVAGKRLEEERQVLALSEAYSLIDELVGAGRFELDKATSDRAHGLVARYEAIESGHFRGEGSVSGGGTVQLSTGGYVDGVPAEQLPQRWTSLMDYLDGVHDPRRRALIYAAAATRAQFYFDGNKRTARIMMTGVLMAAGFEAVNIPYARRLEYNTALDTLFATDDATQLLEFTASCAITR